MYFVQNKEEIHLSFKNSEKSWTQALNIHSAVNERVLIFSRFQKFFIQKNFPARVKDFLSLTFIISHEKCKALRDPSGKTKKRNDTLNR